LREARKPKISIKEQIKHLADRGVKFEIINKERAYSFLTKNTYFYKLKSYCDNYEKDQNGKYINLDFAYLVDLSTLDMHLRRFINTLTLNIEHTLKTKLLADFNESPFDGYDIVESFLNGEKGEKALNYIKSIKNDNTNYSPKLPSDLRDLPIWHFIEVIQFGHLIFFCRHFYDSLKNEIDKSSLNNYVTLDREHKVYARIQNALHNVKCLRNAAAHNNCILLLGDNRAARQKGTLDFLLHEKIYSITDEAKIRKILRNRTINDLTTSLWVFDKLCLSEGIRRNTFAELNELLGGRFVRHCNYYADNSLLIEKYQFMTKVVAFFCWRNS
jgi:abortive infection bacteriophage resistance protein